MKNNILKLVLSAAALSAFGVAQGATATSNFDASAVMNHGCTIDTTATSTSFNTLDMSATGSGATNVTTFNFQCTKGATYDISFNAGYGRSYANRSMKAGNPANTDKLKYNIYLDSSLTTIAGNGLLGTGTIAGTGNGTVVTSNLYVHIPYGQYVTPDIYTDDITVTVLY